MRHYHYEDKRLSYTPHSHFLVFLLLDYLYLFLIVYKPNVIVLSKAWKEAFPPGVSEALALSGIFTGIIGTLTELPAAWQSESH